MYMDLTDKQQLIDYLQKNGLYTKHELGQNFLVDRRALDRIVEAAELKERDEEQGTMGQEVVFEVGPGLGTLTAELVGRAGEVIAIEKDEKLAELLISKFQFLISNQFQISNVKKEEGVSEIIIKNLDTNNSLKNKNYKLKILTDDILKVNLPELIGERKYKVVANIPYYITSKILKLFLTMEKRPESIVVLTQKEVAQRIIAKPGDMSVLSVSVQAYGEPEIIDIVPKESFFPSPKVDSAILRIKNIHPFKSTKSETRNPKEYLPYTPPNLGGEGGGINEKAFFRLVHIGFASRRKTLQNNLSAGYHITKTEASDIIKKAGLPENVRAQELSIEDWQRLVSSIGYLV